MNHLSLIFVTYDGINNSVFAGQVLQPLIDQRKKDYDRKICLISFEPEHSLAFEHTKKQCMQHDIQLIIAHKKRFMRKSSLQPAIHQLKTILTQYPHYELIARGPLAGYIALQSSDAKKCHELTIQARGLLAEEYAYTHRNANIFARALHSMRTKQFKTLEKAVYGTTKPNVTIECVSPALKNYLMEQFGTPEQQITLAQQDIPIKINPAQKTEWRNSIRTKLGIPADTHVYCYNGSAKPWQCPNETLQFFKEQYAKNNKSFLLILSEDVHTFTQLAQAHGLASTCYTIQQVPHTKIYEYLSACDTGLIFRDENILNWVSRPTKILEYQSVGLDVKHNNTIAYLTEAVAQSPLHSHMKENQMQ